MRNVVIILSDQQRWDSIGINGNHGCTPVIDELASGGTVFTNAFTPQPVCGPARSCIQTGLYATQTGCYRNDVPLKENAVTLAKLFRQEGYATAYIGKWHLASNLSVHENYIENPPPPSRMGGYEQWMVSDALELTSDGYGGYLFDTQGQKHDFAAYRVDAVNNYALDFLDTWNARDRQNHKPFLLFVSFIEPHQQNSTDSVQGPRDPNPDLTYPVPGDLEPGQGNWEENLEAYMQCCNRIDRETGKLLEKLKKLGIYEETLVVYTSDHGCHFKTRGPEYKRTCHDSSIRIPLILQGGVFNQGGRRNDTASLIDLLPTLSKYAGIPCPPGLAGRDLAELPKGELENTAYIQISERSLSRAIRTPRYCYCITDPTADPIGQSYSNSYQDAFLYDLETDPHQQHNKINDPSFKSVKEHLRQVLRKKALEANEWIHTITDQGGSP